MFVTLDISQAPISTSKRQALKNMLLVFVTFDISQLAIFGSALFFQLENILLILVTGVVQQRDRSSPAFLFEIKRVLFTAVYVTPFISPVSPELAPGQTIVIPFGAKEN